MGVGSDVSWDRTFRWYVQGAHGEGARRGPVLASARAGNINLRRKYIKRPDARADVHAASHRVGFDESMYRTREQQQDGPGRLRLGLRGLDAVDARGLCGNQTVSHVHPIILH